MKSWSLGPRFVGARQARSIGHLDLRENCPVVTCPAESFIAIRAISTVVPLYILYLPSHGFGVQPPHSWGCAIRQEALRAGYRPVRRGKVNLHLFAFVMLTPLSRSRHLLQEMSKANSVLKTRQTFLPPSTCFTAPSHKHLTIRLLSKASLTLSHRLLRHPTCPPFPRLRNKESRFLGRNHFPDPCPQTSHPSSVTTSRHCLLRLANPFSRRWRTLTYTRSGGCSVRSRDAC